MNIKQSSVLALAISILASNGSAFAITTTANPALNHPNAPAGEFQLMAFRDRPEADMLRRAYRILATGDHDYKGHRVEAMNAVKKAADLLGYDLGGDDQYRERQVLSDDKMREARDLLKHVLGAAEVKDQDRIAERVNHAIKEIDDALSMR